MDARDTARTAARCAPGRAPGHSRGRALNGRPGAPSTAPEGGAPALMTRPPTTIAVRDATVGPLSGTSDGVRRARGRPPPRRCPAPRRPAAGRWSSSPGPSPWSRCGWSGGPSRRARGGHALELHLATAREARRRARRARGRCRTPAAARPPAAARRSRADRASASRVRSNSAASAARSRTSCPATLSRRICRVGVMSPSW